MKRSRCLLCGAHSVGSSPAPTSSYGNRDTWEGIHQHPAHIAVRKENETEQEGMGKGWDLHLCIPASPGQP